MVPPLRHSIGNSVLLRGCRPKPVRSSMQSISKQKSLEARLTVQIKDEFSFEGEQFDLFDVSDGKVLSCVKCVGGWPEDECCTACYRGSFASYEVAVGILVLEEAASSNWFKDMMGLSAFIPGHKALYVEARANPGAIIPFTGHLIIVQSSWPMDFFRSIFDADKAYELEFDEGLFVAVTDLEDFIEAGRAYIEAAEKEGRRELPLDAGVMRTARMSGGTARPSACCASRLQRWKCSAAEVYFEGFDAWLCLRTTTRLSLSSFSCCLVLYEAFFAVRHPPKVLVTS